MDELLKLLREGEAIRDVSQEVDKENEIDKVFIRKIERVNPEYDDSDILSRVPFSLRTAITQAGIKNLYKHQSEAINHAFNGHDVVLEAPTASGKTLAFLIPMLDILLKDHSSHALLIYPLKALSNDQRRQIHVVTEKLPPNERKIESWHYDGDTEDEHRKIMRNNPPAILITNPEMLHLSFMGSSDKWKSFLKKNKIYSD